MGRCLPFAFLTLGALFLPSQRLEECQGSEEAAEMVGSWSASSVRMG